MKNPKYPNLKPWPPGQSGNPAGRKPGSKNISTIVRELLDQEATADMLIGSGIAELVQGAPKNYAQVVVWVAIQKALQGDMRAIQWLAEQQERNGVQQDVLRREPIVVSHLKPRNQSTVD